MGAGAWQQLDLSGSESEWVLDYANKYVDPCINCAATANGSFRSLRGGAFNSAGFELAPGLRFQGPGTMRRADLGVRCARTP
jgi:formylglycine-generating enzyme required for sulfatase activity